MNFGDWFLDSARDTFDASPAVAAVLSALRRDADGGTRGGGSAGAEVRRRRSTSPPRSPVPASLDEQSVAFDLTPRISRRCESGGKAAVAPAFVANAAFDRDDWSAEGLRQRWSSTFRRRLGSKQGAHSATRTGSDVGRLPSSPRTRVGVTSDADAAAGASAISARASSDPPTEGPELGGASPLDGTAPGIVLHRCHLLHVRGWWSKGARIVSCMAEIRGTSTEGFTLVKCRLTRGGTPDTATLRYVSLAGAVAVPENIDVPEYPHLSCFRIWLLPSGDSAEEYLDFGSADNSERDAWLQALEHATRQGSTAVARTSASGCNAPLCGRLLLTVRSGGLDLELLLARWRLTLSGSSIFAIVRYRDMAIRTAPKRPSSSSGSAIFERKMEFPVYDDDPDSLVTLEMWAQIGRKGPQWLGVTSIPLFCFGRHKLRELALPLRDPVIRGRGTEDEEVGSIMIDGTFDQPLESVLLPRVAARSERKDWESVGEKTFMEQFKELDTFLKEFEVFSSRFMHHCDTWKRISIVARRVVQWDDLFVTLLCLLLVTVVILFYHDYVLPLFASALLGLTAWYHPWCIQLRDRYEEHLCSKFEAVWRLQRLPCNFKRCTRRKRSVPKATEDASECGQDFSDCSEPLKDTNSDAGGAREHTWFDTAIHRFELSQERRKKMHSAYERMRTSFRWHKNDPPGDGQAESLPVIVPVTRPPPPPVKYLYENERRLMLGKFNAQRLRFYDPPAWCDAEGHRAEPPSMAPDEDGVQYHWRIDVNQHTDNDGWRYAKHFGKFAASRVVWSRAFQPSQSFVRSRRHNGKLVSESHQPSSPAKPGGPGSDAEASERSGTPTVPLPTRSELSCLQPAAQAAFSAFSSTDNYVGTAGLLLRPSLPGIGSPGDGKRSVFAGPQQPKGPEFGIARTPFHDMYQQCLMRWTFLQRQIEYWMDWYERRKNLFLGVTLHTQTFALIGMCAVVMAAWVVPTRLLILGGIYTFFYDGLALGRLMREHQSAVIAAFKAEAAKWLECDEQAQAKAAAWGSVTSIDEVADAGVQLLALRDWIRAEFYDGRPMIPLRAVQSSGTLGELAAQVVWTSGHFERRRARRRVWYKNTFRNLLDHVPSDITLFQPFVCKGLGDGST